jgi:hypothetical protein
MATPFLVGLSLAAGAYGIKAINTFYNANKANLPNLALLFSGSKYKRGGFEPEMSKREALMILGFRYIK